MSSTKRNATEERNAQKLTKLARIMKMERPELRQSINLSKSFGVTTTGRFESVFEVPEIISWPESGRVALEIQPVELEWRYSVTCNTGYAGPQSVRMMLMRDKQVQSSSEPDIQEILDDISIPTLSGYNKLIPERFEILYDVTHDMQRSTESSRHHVVVRRKLDDKGPLRFNSANSTGIQQNGYFVFMCADTANTASIAQWLVGKYFDN
jgi:hypothetical protein